MHNTSSCLEWLIVLFQKLMGKSKQAGTTLFTRIFEKLKNNGRGCGIYIYTERRRSFYSSPSKVPKHHIPTLLHSFTMAQCINCSRPGTHSSKCSCTKEQRYAVGGGKKNSSLNSSRLTLLSLPLPYVPGTMPRNWLQSEQERKLIEEMRQRRRRESHHAPTHSSQAITCQQGATNCLLSGHPSSQESSTCYHRSYLDGFQPKPVTPCQVSAPANC